MHAIENALYFSQKKKRKEKKKSKIKSVESK